MLNMSSCQISESKQNLLVLVHNPLSRKQTVRVRLPVTGLIKVFDNEKSQIEVDYAAIPDEVLNLRGRDSNAKVEALFEIENVRALGIIFFARRQQTCLKYVYNRLQNYLCPTSSWSSALKIF